MVKGVKRKTRGRGKEGEKEESEKCEGVRQEREPPAIKPPSRKQACCLIRE